MASAIQASYAKILGAILALVGIAGFVMNPVVGIFGVTTIHNIIHIVSGIVLVAAGYMSDGKNAKTAVITFGFIYLAVAVLGFANIAPVVSTLNINLADNILHIAIAIVTLGVGFGAKD